MLQIRIADYDGSNPIILEQAKRRRHRKSINSSDEGISFTVAKNSPKADVLNPDVAGYSKRWEVWDTDKNKRLNFGPITSIAEEGSDWKVQGDGRSARLRDFYKTEKTFYAPIIDIFDGIRYENLAVQPRTVTLIPDITTSAEQTTVFGSSVNIDEKYHGLSKKTKDLAIDDDTGLLKPGEIEPSNTIHTTDSFWSGMSKSDTHIVDLGGIYPVNKIQIYLPAWGGATRYYNRTYTFRISFATDEGSTTTLQDREFGPFVTIYQSDNPNRKAGNTYRWVGYDSSSTLVAVEDYEYLQPLYARYIRTEILNTHAWYGTVFDDEPSVDAWTFQCDPDYVTGSIPSRGDKPAVMEEEINTRTLEVENDCHASIKEIQILSNILDRDTILPLGRQRIDNNNFQITYTHTPDASETTTTDNGFRRFEPGGFFRKVTFTYSGAGGPYNKFFDSDCTNCFPDGFRFGIMDQHNNMVYATDTTSGTVSRTFGAYTSFLTMKGASNATITSVDSWQAKLDSLSWGSSYSYTKIAGDTATIHFRGQSFRWYATVPDGETGAVVSMQIRNKDINGSWTSFTTLTSNFKLPDNIHSEVVYEIPYESGYLQPDTIYEIKITNTDGGFCSIDSIEGYWSASMVEYNEDSLRISVANPENIKQIYDRRFTGGSMYKFFEPAFVGFSFVGDRVIVLSAKGRNHGTARLLLRNLDIASDYDPGIAGHIFIPGGNPVDGSLSIDLNTGKRGNEITQYVLFDSKDYFPDGLPWGKYAVNFYLYHADLAQYNTTVLEAEFDSFVARCKDCVTPSGETITINKPVHLDSILAHELIGLSVAFDEEEHLEILKSTADALQVEWDVTDSGLRVEPRIGRDTFDYLREGDSTLVSWNIVNDISQMATMLLSHGADIDGLPLFTITEDKETRARLGRTVMRRHDFRGNANYLQLIGLSRTELKRRAYPEKRMTVTYTGNRFDLEAGDSFMLWTRKMGDIRVRIETKDIDESNGREFILECVKWPQII